MQRNREGLTADFRNEYGFPAFHRPLRPVSPKQNKLSPAQIACYTAIAAATALFGAALAYAALTGRLAVR